MGLLGLGFLGLGFVESAGQSQTYKVMSSFEV